MSILLLIRYKTLLSFALLGLCSVAVHYYYVLWVRPKRLREELSNQGVGGPKPSFPNGNIAEIKMIQQSTAKMEQHVLDCYMATLFPYIEQWRKEYGSVFMYSTGNRLHLCVSHPDMVKDIGIRKFVDMDRPTYQSSEVAPIIGTHGILRVTGQRWADQRKLFAPEFFMEKVKGMIGLMIESTLTLCESWEERVGKEGGVLEMRIDEDMRGLSADVISRACFGSSFEKGKEIFNMLSALKLLIGRRNFLFGIPNFRYLPTKINREIWRMEKNINSSIMNVVKERKEGKTMPSSSTKPKDLLTILLENSNASALTSGDTQKFIVDNCKNFYFAGHDTSAIIATWSLVLLAAHPEWQTRARAEVLELCKGELPNVDSISTMKVLTMVIQETLRLYPPSAFVPRQTIQAVKLGNINVPKGVNVWVPIPALHRDPKIWGPDVNEFKPDRFEHGITAACKIPHAYLPFGNGPRICLGQNFAHVELKIILSLILSRFSFSLSPNYKHSPRLGLLVEPGSEVLLFVEKIRGALKVTKKIGGLYL